MPTRALIPASMHAAWWSEIILPGLLQTLVQVVYVAGPFFVLGVVLHRLRTISQGRLSARFGWLGILLTAWIGTPVHEGSHALMCVLFRHRIQGMALFEPDPASGVLGYVRHTHDPRSVYQVVGNFFIGVAPFLGGALALFGLLAVFEPSVARQALRGDEVARMAASGHGGAAALALAESVAALLRQLLTPEHLRTPGFWVFLYLVLGVGSHLAPSPSDYAQARFGGLVLLSGLALFNSLFLAFGGRPGAVTGALAAALAPVFALLLVALALSALTTGLVVALSTLGARRARGDLR